MIKSRYLFQRQGIGHDQSSPCRFFFGRLRLFGNQKEFFTVNRSELRCDTQLLISILPTEYPVQHSAIIRQEINGSVIPAIPIFIDKKYPLRIIDSFLYIWFYRYGIGIIRCIATGFIVIKYIGISILYRHFIDFGLSLVSAFASSQTMPCSIFRDRRRIPMVLFVDTLPFFEIIRSRCKLSRSIRLRIGRIAADNQCNGILPIQVETQSIDRVTTLPAHQRKQTRIRFHHIVQHFHDCSFLLPFIAPRQRSRRFPVVPSDD